MKKTIIAIIGLFLCANLLQAQNEIMYIMKSGAIIKQFNLNTEVDSIIFYYPNNKPVITLELQSEFIPAGTFTMGSSNTEEGRESTEVEHQVTLSAFRMSKFEITNAQYAAFLNAKSILKNGLYTAGAYPTQTLIFESSGSHDWGLHYNGYQWVPVAGYENHPVIMVTWYGAAEFATYSGGSLPTDAQWEYACRANTTTPFNTGDCLSNTQANYDWSNPYGSCTNIISTSPGSTQKVGSYPPNSYGLYDMHGNAAEWCNDRFGTSPTTPQTDPTGPLTGPNRVFRPGSYASRAQECRSASRTFMDASYIGYNLGFRIVFVP